MVAEITVSVCLKRQVLKYSLLVLLVTFFLCDFLFSQVTEFYSHNCLSKMDSSSWQCLCLFQSTSDGLSKISFSHNYLRSDFYRGNWVWHLKIICQISDSFTFIVKIVLRSEKWLRIPDTRQHHGRVEGL